MDKDCCKFCVNRFNLTNHRPKELKCSHIICLECCSSLQKSTGYIICVCTEKEDHKIESLKEPNHIIDHLNYTLLYCYTHKLTTDKIHRQTLIPICRSCDNPKESVDSAELLLLISQKVCTRYLRQKKKFSKEIRNTIKLVFLNDLYSNGLQKKLDTLNMISQYSNKRMNCFKHLDHRATKIRTDTYQLLCEECTSPYEPLYVGNQSIQFYIDQFQSLSPENFELIPFTVVKSLNETNETIQPYIEIVEMYKKLLTSLDKIGCQSCGKLYHLGQKMPIKLSCGHVICYQCLKTVKNCLICRNNIIEIEFYPIQSLYKWPICSDCNSFITFENLPFHNVCDCIICANCTILGKKCQKCHKYNEII